MGAIQIVQAAFCRMRRMRGLVIRYTALEDLADKLVKAGIREVDGNVTGVATRYPGERYPDGWTIDDAIYSYGAPVTSLAQR